MCQKTGPSTKHMAKEFLTSWFFFQDIYKQLRVTQKKSVGQIGGPGEGRGGRIKKGGEEREVRREERGLD